MSRSLVGLLVVEAAILVMTLVTIAVSARRNRQSVRSRRFWM